MKEVCGVDVEEVAGTLNNLLRYVGNRNNRSVKTVSTTAINEDMEFNPYFSTNFEDEIVEVLSGIQCTIEDEFEADIIEMNPGKSYAHLFIDGFKGLNSFKREAEAFLSTFSYIDKC